MFAICELVDGEAPRLQLSSVDLEESQTSRVLRASTRVQIRSVTAQSRTELP